MKALICGPRPACCIRTDLYQVSLKSVNWFRRRFLKDFYHIWAWRPSWSCDPDTTNKLSVPLPIEQNLALIGQAVFENKMFEHCE